MDLDFFLSCDELYIPRESEDLLNLPNYRNPPQSFFSVKKIRCNYFFNNKKDIKR